MRHQGIMTAWATTPPAGCDSNPPTAGTRMTCRRRPSGKAAMSKKTALRKSHQIGHRPPFEVIALLLQGGGALGSYQGGVYQALAEAGLHPDWISGISIGAINSAIIAGNPPDRRVERLREFWETVTRSPVGIPYFRSIDIPDDTLRHYVNQARALNVLLFGAPHFFFPRWPPAAVSGPADPSQVSFYDNSPLR